MKAETIPLINKKYPFFGYYEILIFCFLLFEFVLKTSEFLFEPVDMMSYISTYEFGFGSRKLIGSIVSLFVNHITNHYIYIISIILFILLIVLISLLLGSVIRKSDFSVKPAIIIFALLFLSSPYSVTYLLGINAPQLDIYWILLTLLALVFLKRPILRWLIPFMCAAAILTEESYIFTYMPALVIPMLYEVYKSKYSRKSIVVFCSSCFVMITLFFSTRFITANIPFDNTVDLANFLSKRADFHANELWVYSYYFSDFHNNIKMITEVTLPLTSTYALPLGVFLVTISMPLIIIFVYVWKKCIRHADNKFLKFIFILCLISPLAFIPAALMGNDWDRWWAAAINTQFIVFFYLAYSGEKVLIDYARRVDNFFDKHFLLLLLIIIVTISLANSEAVSNVFYFAHDVDAAITSITNFLNERGLQNFLN